MSGEIIAILAVGVTLLAVLWGALVPILVSINGKLHTLGERVARIEGITDAARHAGAAEHAGTFKRSGARDGPLTSPYSVGT